MIRIALLGHPNVGKSTIFNAITGLKQKTGNWPGKTVSISWGDVDYKGLKLRFVDLPGTYSIKGENEAEKVVEEYLETKPDVVVVVADASTLHESLYPLIQVMEKGLRTVLVINMMDEAEKMGVEIDLNKMKEKLGIPVIGAIAKRGKGIKEIKEAAVEVLKKKPVKIKERSARERYKFIDELLRECVRGSPKRDEKIDFFLFNPIFDFSLIAITSIFLLLPVFYVATFTERLIEALGFVENFGFIGSALSAVLTFLPSIFVFYFVFTILEDTGILARVAAAIDSYMPFPGVGFFPLLMSFGCNVLGIPATRIIKDKKYKIGVALAVPFVLCSTRISVLLILLSYFPIKSAALIGLSIIFFMFSFVILTAYVFSGFSKKEPLFIELPPMRFPSLKTVFSLSLSRTLSFLIKIAVWISLGAAIGEVVSNANLFEKTTEKIAFNLFLGFFAKELTLGSLISFFGTPNLLTFLNFKQAVSFLLFYSFYTPCLPTLVAINSELGKKYALLSFFWNLAISFLSSILVLLF